MKIKIQNGSFTTLCILKGLNLQRQHFQEPEKDNLFVLFGLRFYVPFNSYGHLRWSVHLTTLFHGQA